jgi:di/tricarboxylate transporter
LIGTSTNLAVSGALPRYGIEPFTMFELTRVGIVIVGVGMLYMLLMGLRLLPRRKPAESLTEQYHIRQYMTEVIVLDDSPLIGKSLAEAQLGAELDVTVLGILRGQEQYRIAPHPAEKIKTDDLLLVQGRVEDILKVKAEAGIEIKPDFTLNDSVLEGKDTELFEAMVARGSDFIGRTLKRLDFRKRYGLVVLAINRHGVNLLSKISRVRLRFGDVLLLQGNRDHVERLAADGQILLLEDVSEKQARPEKRRWALLAFGVFLFFSLTHLVPLPIAVLFGVMILLASQSLRMSEVYEIIDWRLLILIACMMSFGVAMENTGADQYLANCESAEPVWTNGGAGWIFLNDSCAYAAHVKPGCGARDAADIGENCGRTWIKPEDVCNHRYLRGIVFLPDTTRTGVCSGLHTGTLQLFGLRESGLDPDDRSIRDRHLVGARVLAFTIVRHQR